MKKGLMFLFAALAGTNLMAATLHVDLNSTNPTAPYATRETAATDIQTAVNAAVAGDTVQVWDGHYLLASQISVSKAITIQSVNGPESTIVDGQGSVRCFSLGRTACVIQGLKITNGYSSGGGGGIYCSDTTPVVSNCILRGNKTTRYGGGMYYGTANNCTLSGNSAQTGGGMYRGTANNCTISGNSATQYGGGMAGGTVNNCIIWYNTAPSGKDLDSTTARYSCSPDVTHGVDGNIRNAPMLVSSSHIAADSPCRGAGSADYATGTDIDGEFWVNPPSMGCDEPADFPGGSMEVDFVANESIVLSGYSVQFQEQIHGALSQHVWDFGDGTRVTNSLFVEHAWASAGTFNVVLTAYNADWPGGVSATQEVSVISFEETAIHVSPNGNDANDGTSWASAKATIQAGVDAQGLLGGGVLVGSGTYSLSSTITVSKRVRIVSVDGPGTTIVDGQGSVRCFDLGNSACLVEGLTITNGYSSGDGGGVYCLDTTPVVTNCIISGNSASYGGGMYRGTANNCTISDNTSTQQGGGIFDCTANNCTMSGNTSTLGGGLYRGTANNCIISENSATWGGGMYYGTVNNSTISGNSGRGLYSATANNCTITGNSGGGMYRGTANNCIVWYSTTGKDLDGTTASYSCSPDVTHGLNGNITNAPVFVSSSHIAANSPCRGAGSVNYTSGADIDGDAWVNPPSMGCDEPADFPGGPIEVGFVADELRMIAGYPIQFKGQIHGALSGHVWDFGDGTEITNSLSVEHAWATLGTYDVVLTAYNADWPNGVSMTQEVSIVSLEEYVIHVSPYGDDANDGTSWASAKATIQSGVDAQGLPGGWVLVGSGTYSLSTTITVTKPVYIKGVDESGSTIVDGQGSVRCFNLGNTACVVEGLTITNGNSSGDGGGIYCSGIVPVVTNCIISGNTAARGGGGMVGGTANNCILSGNTAYTGGGMEESTANNCTIIGNFSSAGGGMSRGTANNCTISGNEADGYGGGIWYGTANNCTISGNSGDGGGGMYEGTATNCIISGNSSPQYRSGGGMYRGTAYNCTISGNSGGFGGGMDDCTAYDCTISGNTADRGGGAEGCTLSNCTIFGNMAYEGGGVAGSTLSNCAIFGNFASNVGGGCDGSVLTHCTITGNTSDVLGGGTSGCTLTNCIVYANTAFSTDDNWVNDTFSYSCTTPLPEGEGNISEDPILLGPSHIHPDSPCVGAGSAVQVSDTDIDGDAWNTFSSMGCDEPSAPFDGPLSVSISMDGSKIAKGYALGFFAEITGEVTSNRWAFGDGKSLPNATYPEHAWGEAGNYDVVLTAWNDDFPDGVSATAQVQVVASSTYYVDAGNASPVAPYSSWATAATNIQDAVDVADDTWGSTVLVADGFYTAGGAVTPGFSCMNRVVITNDITVQSVNGPEYTYIVGEGPLGSNAVRGVYMSSGILSGFTITNGHTMTSGQIYYDCMGGGVSLNAGDGPTIRGGDGLVTNCILTGNASYDSGGGSYKGSLSHCIISGNTSSVRGGGSYNCSLYNCILSGNTADLGGGGIYQGTANNCTITGNSASDGGGMYQGTANNCTISGNSAEELGGGIYNGAVNNCIVWYNEAPTENDLSSATARFSCSPDLAHGVDGNITNAPLLTADGHVDWNSPCRGAGNMAYATGTDIDGEAWDNPPSIGCDEYHGEGEDWLQVMIESFDTIAPNGFPLSFRKYVEGPANLVVWDFGDGTQITNSISVEHAWAASGIFNVVLTAYNAYWPDGVSATQEVSIVSFEESAIHVSQNGNDANDGASWESAKKTIQAGVDAQDLLGGGVLVGSGTYSLSATIAVSKPVHIVGVDGPGSTIVDGQDSVRCFDLGNTACVIEGLTITNGDGGDNSGGGIYCSDATPVVANCFITGNRASSGGGVYNGTANNCTISGNTGSEYGGGMCGGSANNCIVYGNTSSTGNDLYDTTARYSCSPDVTFGVNGNITNAPMFVASSHIAADSPCRGAGSADYASGTDIDGEAWANPPSMGCDEPYGTTGGNINVSFTAGEDGVLPSEMIAFKGMVEGAALMHVWDFGDGTQVSNSLFVEHAWAASGTFNVVLTAYNADWSDGVSATQEVWIASMEELSIRVSPDGDDANDGRSWANAKATIQAGIDAQDLPGGWILVGSGTYSLSETITVSKPVRIVGVDGPGSTIVDGLGSVRSFNLGNTACVVEGLTITNGYTSGDGGGIYCSGIVPVVTNCTISGNSARNGGGMYTGTANNCTIIGNSASNDGGGMSGSTANNCAVSGNLASRDGGGMYAGTANNCTISGNKAVRYGGGMRAGTANNCIVWYDTAPSGKDLYSTTASYSCSPDVTHGVGGNITNAPVFVSSSHIAADSPCRGAGSVDYTTGTDIDGEAWVNPPSMGCDEPAELPRGPIDVAFVANQSMVLTGCPIQFKGQIHGALSAHIWDFGDGTRVTNSLSVEHAWVVPGIYDVVLTAYNADSPGGVSATQEISIVSFEESAIHVSLNGNDANDGASWESAKATIQAGVDAQDLLGGGVLVGSGTYFLSETITVSKPVRILSVDGPESTIVNGQGSVRCFNLGNTACVIEGLTITNGYAGNGGGIYCLDTTPVVTNCTISGNRAGGSGGGMCKGTANNCTISGNSAGERGGGMNGSTANNCTISGNTASEYGGGMNGSTANNCAISGNFASWYGGGMSSCTANNCTVSGNRAGVSGGGMSTFIANNCTVIGNTASKYGGGMYEGTANNCIVWYNTSPSGKDLYTTTARYSCSPEVTHGANGNITNAPLFTISSRIAADSPCRGAGSTDYATGTDMDGEAWANPPSMGCDEPCDTTGGDITVSFTSSENKVLPGEMIAFKGMVEGAPLMYVWDFCDGTQVTNSPSVEHVWAALGTYHVVLTAYNGDWPDGVSATQEVSIVSLEGSAIHVSPTGSDANDGTSWESAKATIQAGVDAQDLRDGWILIDGGTYSLSTMITVSNPVHIVGVDGPESTIVDGQGSVRCFNLGNTACVVEGLTITNGYTSGDGGGIYCSGIVPIVTNCTISGNVALSTNIIYNGGSGGGMVGGTANNCTIIGNSATDGGGMYKGMANNCTISDNSARNGGGMYRATANNCTISDNSASLQYGGGMYEGTANNCTITGNSAPHTGGGMYNSTANNCTISGNSAFYGSGMSKGTANNCIVWFNTAPSGKDLYSTTASYSCSPDVTHGSNGNITNAPMLASSSHIAADSPCRGKGSTDYATGTDIDGNAWANPPSMGCDEPSDDLLRGPIEVNFVANDLMMVPCYPIQFQGQIHGALSEHVWDFGDGTQITNSLPVKHAWASAGIFDVVLTAYNADWPGGVSATQKVTIVSFEETAIHVSLNGNDANDGRNWASAKATIQAGVDAQGLPSGWVLVESGTYSLSAAITVSNPVHIVGVDGSGSTIVDGQGSVSCFDLGDTACVIEGLTITNGYADNGGGVYCSDTTPVVTNCTISGNSATRGGGMHYGTANNCTISGNSTRWGGGMYYGTANNCTIIGNSATDGGGMYKGMANNCTISGNSATYGGGMNGGTAKNTIVYGNTAPKGNNFYLSSAYYTCSPDLTHGVNGNITTAPVFVDAANGDYRLAAGSRCIDAGANDYVVGSLDVAGLPRIVDGRVDMGAYEYQGAVIGDQDSDGLPDDWETEHFGSTAGQGAEDDYDNDLLDNISEWIAGTDPGDPNSVFTASVSPNQVPSDGFLIEWSSVEDRTYSVLWGRSLTNDYQVLQNGITYPQNSYTDTVHNAESAGFYRVEVRMK